MDNYPTEAQYMQASVNGSIYAELEISQGNREAQDAPLSGEWAGSPVPRDIAEQVGYTDLDNGEALDELSAQWEDGYYAAFAELEEKFF